MASGVQHARASTLLTIPAAIFALGATNDPGLAFWCAVGSLSGVLLSPDLDIHRRTHSEYIVYKKLGNLAGALWFALWWPYSWFIPHRSNLSHFPILGTAIRLLYMFGWYVLFWFAAHELLPGIPPVSLGAFSIPIWIWWAIIGLAISDTAHYIMDKPLGWLFPQKSWGRRKRRR